jgi:hypothetical protein
MKCGVVWELEKASMGCCERGWKANVSNMEVYNKATLGYTDDDYLLKGGFQQMHEVV